MFYYAYDRDAIHVFESETERNAWVARNRQDRRKMNRAEGQRAAASELDVIRHW